jgi:transitional endoplasmic reticulum ATPase
VTPGDYVNVENTLGQDKAVGVAREDDPSGQHARVEKVTDDYILVQTNSRSRILANPAEDVSPGDGVLLTELGEFYVCVYPEDSTDGTA